MKLSWVRSWGLPRGPGQSEGEYLVWPQSAHPTWRQKVRHDGLRRTIRSLRGSLPLTCCSPWKKKKKGGAGGEEGFATRCAYSTRVVLILNNNNYHHGRWKEQGPDGWGSVASPRLVTPTPAHLLSPAGRILHLESWAESGGVAARSLQPQSSEARVPASQALPGSLWQRGAPAKPAGRARPFLRRL